MTWPSLPATILDETLVLRRWRLDDEAALIEARTLTAPALADWTPGMSNDLADVPAFLEFVVAQFDAARFSAFAIEVDGEPIGYLSLVRDDPVFGLPEAEVAYWVRSDRTGRGVASTAVALAVQAAFSTWPDLAQVTLRCDARNVRSSKVAERCGFTRTAEESVAPRTPAQSGVEVRWSLDRQSAERRPPTSGGDEPVPVPVGVPSPSRTGRWGADMGNARSSGASDVEAFARTFAPDRARRAAAPREYLWLGGGVVLVAATVVLLALGWFALQRSLPTTGPLAMRGSPRVSVEELRNRNHDAAPWMAVSSLPLFVAGTWLLVRRPGNKRAKLVVTGGAVVFAGLLLVASSVGGGCVGVGSC